MGHPDRPEDGAAAREGSLSRMRLAATEEVCRLVIEQLPIAMLARRTTAEEVLSVTNPFRKLADLPCRLFEAVGPVVDRLGAFAGSAPRADDGRPDLGLDAVLNRRGNLQVRVVNPTGAMRWAEFPDGEDLSGMGMRPDDEAMWVEDGGDGPLSGRYPADPWRVAIGDATVRMATWAFHEVADLLSHSFHLTILGMPEASIDGRGRTVMTISTRAERLRAMAREAEDAERRAASTAARRAHADLARKAAFHAELGIDLEAVIARAEDDVRRDLSAKQAAKVMSAAGVVASENSLATRIAEMKDVVAATATIATYRKTLDREQARLLDADVETGVEAGVFQARLRMAGIEGADGDTRVLAVEAIAKTGAPEATVSRRLDAMRFPGRGEPAARRIATYVAMRDAQNGDWRKQAAKRLRKRTGRLDPTGEGLATDGDAP